MSATHLLPFTSFRISYIQLREGVVEAIDEKNQFLSIIYIASGKGQLLRKGEQTVLNEGKSYWIKEASILTSTSAKLLSVYKLSWMKESEERTSLLSASLADQLPSKIVPLWEEVLGLQSGKTFLEQCRFQAKVWDLLTALTDHTRSGHDRKSNRVVKESYIAALFDY